MHQDAALHRVEPGVRRFGRLRVEAVQRERAERAGRLVGDHRRAAGQRGARRERRSYGVFHGLDVRGGMDQIAMARIRGQRQLALRQIAQQRTRQQLPLAFGRGMGQHHLARGAEPAARDRAVERERGFDRGLGHLRLALRFERQEGIGPRMDRPGIVGEAHDPQMIEGDARGFEHAQDLHRRLRRLGLEQRLAPPAA